jgi:hypothetical protein
MRPITLSTMLRSAAVLAVELEERAKSEPDPE